MCHVTCNAHQHDCDRKMSLQSHSHVHSIRESLNSYLFMQTAQPALVVATFQRFSMVETQRCHLVVGDGLIRLSRVNASLCWSISAPTSKTLVLLLLFDDFLTLLHIMAFLFLVLDVTHVPLMGNAPEALLHMRLIRLPCFPMRTKFRASYVHPD